RRAVGLELDIPVGRAEGGRGRGGAPLPVAHGPAVVLTDGPNGVVADGQAAQLAQVGGGAVERPAGPRQAEQALGVRANEARDPEALIEGMASRLAARADQVEAPQLGVAGGSQDRAAGPPLVPGELVAVGAAAGRRPFFSAVSAWACNAASTALRVSSRPA